MATALRTKSKKSSSDDTVDDATALRVAEIVNESLALRIIELLSDDVLLSNLKKALFPNQLATKIDALTLQVSHLTSQLDKKVERIAELETNVQSLEDANDALEQYSRRPNIRISGIAETTDGEDTDEKVLAVINGKMNLQPPLQIGQIERSHRVGRKTTDSQRDECGPPRPRPIIVRLCSERVRDVVFRSQTGLKEYNRQNQDHQIFLNEDLTAVRARIFFEARQLKRRKKIADCWSSYGKIVVKDLQNKISEIRSSKDLTRL